MVEYRHSQSQQCHQLFTGHPLISDRETSTADKRAVEPMFHQDLFVFLAESSVSLIGAPLRVDVYHLVHLCYVAEVMKVLTAVVHFPKVIQALSLTPTHRFAETNIQTSINTSDHFKSLKSLQDILLYVQKSIGKPLSGNDHNEHDGEYDHTTLQRLYKLVYTYALAFLRKSVLLLHVRFGVDFTAVSVEDAEASELTRLESILRLPSLNEVISSLDVRTSSSKAIISLVDGWIEHWGIWRQDYQMFKGSTPPFSLSHPAIFELVGLPRNYDTLTDEAIRRSCPTTGKPLTDACLCLFCGQIFCSQAGCCMRNRYLGGCTQHLEQ